MHFYFIMYNKLHQDQSDMLKMAVLCKPSQAKNTYVFKCYCMKERKKIMSLRSFRNEKWKNLPETVLLKIMVFTSWNIYMDS